MNRALLVIDVQNSFRHRPYWPWCSNPDLVARVAPLVERARADGDLVVWVLHTEPGTGGPFEPDSPHVSLMDGLEPAPDEPVLVKTSRNAFTTTNLGQLLTERGSPAWPSPASRPSSAARPPHAWPLTSATRSTS